MINKILQMTGMQSEQERKAKLYSSLLRHEAKIGGELFGAVPKGGRREFFCLDPYTWIWYEEWTDSHKNRQSRTTRYELRNNVIVKIRDGQGYQQLTDHETLRLLDAMKTYERRISTEIYSYVQ